MRCAICNAILDDFLPVEEDLCGYCRAIVKNPDMCSGKEYAHVDATKIVNMYTLHIKQSDDD